MQVIGIDIDDTITKTTEVGNYYLSKFSKDYRDYHDLPIELYYDFLNQFSEDIVKNNILKEGVKEAFNYLKRHNYKIVIITARNNIHTPSVKELTIDFLAKNGLIYDKILFDDENTKSKVSQALEEKVDIFIDDKEDVLDSLSKEGIECLRFSIDNNSKYKTFSNWRDIIDYIKRKED